MKQPTRKHRQRLIAWAEQHQNTLPAAAYYISLVRACGEIEFGSNTNFSESDYGTGIGVHQEDALNALKEARDEAGLRWIAPLMKAEAI